MNEASIGVPATQSANRPERLRIGKNSTDVSSVNKAGETFSMWEGRDNAALCNAIGYGVPVEAARFLQLRGCHIPRTEVGCISSPDELANKSVGLDLACYARNDAVFHKGGYSH